RQKACGDISDRLSWRFGDVWLSRAASVAGQAEGVRPGVAAVSDAARAGVADREPESKDRSVSDGGAGLHESSGAGVVATRYRLLGTGHGDCEFWLERCEFE